jgi:ribosomal protein L11 methyltransferase
MTQTRFFMTTGSAEATRLFAELEPAFEEDGYPLAIIDIDEDRGIREVSLYTDDDAATVKQRLRAVLDAAGFTAEIGVEVLPEIDWVTHSLEGLAPVRAGRFLVHGAHDRHHARPGDLTIEIEAGQAFGTGHHATTSGCLDMIEKVIGSEQPRNALDLGTGSAVLAIALAKLAQIPVLATDIDPVATEVAAENVRLNEVSDYVETKTAPGFHDPLFAARGPFDLIVANILARPLMALAPDMARHVVPGGSAILSGILDRQHDEVLAAYTGEDFRHVETLSRDGWVTIHLKR